MGQTFDFINVERGTSKYAAIYVTGNTNESSLVYFGQQGTSNAACFEGGSGVDIKGVSGKRNALNVYNNQTEHPAVWLGNKGSAATLYVKQEGTGNAAEFQGGSGINIYDVSNSNSAIHIYNTKTTAPTVDIANNASGDALSVKQEGSGDIARFRTKTDKSKLVIAQEKSDIESINLTIYQGQKPVWKPTSNLSDLTLAENVTPIENALNKVLSLEGVSFSWQDKALGEGTEIGVSAEKVGEVLPELVHSNDGQSGLVKYEKLVPVLIEAIKTQQQQIEQLQQQAQLCGGVTKKGNPSIAGSSDWTSEKLSIGVYKIKFMTPFKTLPVVVVNGYIPREEGGAASDNIFSVGPISERSVTIRSFDVESRNSGNAGKPQDAPFTFAAIGIRPTPLIEKKSVIELIVQWHEQEYLKQYSPAIQTMNQALKRKLDAKGISDAFYIKARCYALLQEDDLALYSLQKALEYKETLVNSAEEESDFHQLQSNTRFQALLILFKGFIQNREENYQAGLDNIDQALKLNPDFSSYFVAVNTKANALWGLEKYDEAIALFKEADNYAADDFDRYTAFKNLAFLLSDLERYQEAISPFQSAIQCYEKAEEATIDLLPPRTDLATVFEQQGWSLASLEIYDIAIESFNKTLECDPNNAWAIYGKACCFASRKQVDSALENLKLAIDSEPEVRGDANKDKEWDSLRSNPQFQAIVKA